MSPAQIEESQGSCWEKKGGGSTTERAVKNGPVFPTVGCEAHEMYTDGAHEKDKQVKRQEKRVKRRASVRLASSRVGRSLHGVLSAHLSCIYTTPHAHFRRRRGACGGRLGEPRRLRVRISFGISFGISGGVGTPCLERCGGALGAQFPQPIVHVLEPPPEVRWPPCDCLERLALRTGQRDRWAPAPVGIESVSSEKRWVDLRLTPPTHTAPTRLRTTARAARARGPQHSPQLVRSWSEQGPAFWVL